MGARRLEPHYPLNPMILKSPIKFLDMDEEKEEEKEDEEGEGKPLYLKPDPHCHPLHVIFHHASSSSFFHLAK